jgi:hypothetical protein
MTAPALFRIPIGEVGGFGLALVDRAAVGYLDAWQAPGGQFFPTLTQADYDAGSTTWVCQLSSCALTSSPNVTTDQRVGTFCVKPGETVTVGEETFTVDLGAFQDAHVAAGLQAFLYANRGLEAYWMFSAEGPDGAPRAAGRCRLVSAPIGGDTWTDLTFTLSLPVTVPPDIEFGSGATTEIVWGSGTAPTWTPAAAAASSKRKTTVDA